MSAITMHSSDLCGLIRSGMTIGAPTPMAMQPSKRMRSMIRKSVQSAVFGLDIGYRRHQVMQLYTKVIAAERGIHGLPGIRFNFDPSPGRNERWLGYFLGEEGTPTWAAPVLLDGLLKLRPLVMLSSEKLSNHALLAWAELINGHTLPLSRTRWNGWYLPDADELAPYVREYLVDPLREHPKYQEIAAVWEEYLGRDTLYFDADLTVGRQ